MDELLWYLVQLHPDVGKSYCVAVDPSCVWLPRASLLLSRIPMSGLDDFVPDMGAGSGGNPFFDDSDDVEIHFIELRFCITNVASSIEGRMPMPPLAAPLGPEASPPVSAHARAGAGAATSSFAVDRAAAARLTVKGPTDPGSGM